MLRRRMMMQSGIKSLFWCVGNTQNYIPSLLKISMTPTLKWEYAFFRWNTYNRNGGEMGFYLLNNYVRIGMHAEHSGKLEAYFPYGTGYVQHRTIKVASFPQEEKHILHTVKYEWGKVTLDGLEMQPTGSILEVPPLCDLKFYGIAGCAYLYLKVWDGDNLINELKPQEGTLGLVDTIGSLKIKGRVNYDKMDYFAYELPN